MPGGRFVFKGQKRKKDEEPREFAAGRSITLSGDPTAAGAYVPFAKGLMDRLEAQFLEHGNTRHHTIAVHNGTIRFEVSEGRRAIHIEAGGSNPGFWLCLPTAEGERGGWGPPFTGQDIASADFGQPINEPMGYGASSPFYEGPPYVRFDRNAEDTEWEVKKRAQEQNYTYPVDWKEPGLPIVTWDSIANRYWPHRENYFPSHNDPRRSDRNTWLIGKVWAGETLLFNSIALAPTTRINHVSVLGAALRVEDAPKWVQVEVEVFGEPKLSWQKAEPPETVRAVYLLMVVTDGHPFYRSWETWSCRVGEIDEAGIVNFYKPLRDPEDPESGVAQLYYQMGEHEPTFRGIRTELGNHYGIKSFDPRGKWGTVNLEILAKYGQPFYFSQPATKCSTFTISRIFTVDWAYYEDDLGEGFHTTLDIQDEGSSEGTENISNTSESFPHLPYWVGGLPLIDYGQPCTRIPDIGSTMGWEEAFLNDVFDGFHWEFVETRNETHTYGNAIVYHVWRRRAIDPITGELSDWSELNTFEWTQFNAHRVIEEGPGVRNHFSGTYAVDYQGMELRKMTIDFSVESRGSYSETIPQFGPAAGKSPPSSCICTNTWNSPGRTTTHYEMKFGDFFSYVRDSTSYGVGGVNLSFRAGQCTEVNDPPDPPDNEPAIGIAWLYADMRGAGELFWWETTATGDSVIDWASITQLNGSHVFKSHIDGTIYTGAT